MAHVCIPSSITTNSIESKKKTTTKTAFRYIFATAATSYGLFYLQWVSYCISVPFKRLKRNMLDIMCEFENAVLRSELKRNRKFVMYTKLHTQHIHDNCRGCVINNLSLISSKFLFLLCNWYKTFLKGWFTFHFLERKKKDHRKCSKNWWKVFFPHGFVSWAFSNYMLLWRWFIYTIDTSFMLQQH